MTAKPIRVLVVDDSLLMRRLLGDLLAANSDIQVVGTARDPFEARELIKQFNPDVVTLDVEMPRMDGLSFLEKIMTLRPMPVVMVSSLTAAGADATVRALELGAVDCIAKPVARDAGELAALGAELATKIRSAAHARPQARRTAPHPVRPVVPARADRLSTARLVALGASTGGVERIRDILAALPADAPPLLIVQHMGPLYVPSFAARLQRQSELTVRVAETGDRPRAGLVLVAPGDRHLQIRRDGHGLVVEVSDGPAVSGHRPSVDVMFESVAKTVGNQAVGVILSGMGRDGAAGLLAMRQAGAFTIGESESSCVVYGMPRAAREMGAVAVELPLAQIPAELLRAATERPQQQGKE